MTVTPGGMTAAADWMTGWHPIAAGPDLPHRHIYQGQLLGRELAVWRADDDFVNVWENRCLHRGVRLSVGTNDGRELKCQYHGWRYANRSAGCTYIPAHPANAPARTICNRTFPAVERYGLIWSGEEPDGEPPTIAELEAGATLTLRSIAVDAPPALVVDRLGEYRFSPTGNPDLALNLDLDAEVETTVDERGDLSVIVEARASGRTATVVFFVQPVDSHRSVIRGVLASVPDDAERLSLLRHHNTELCRLRDRAETDAVSAPPSTPMVATIEQVPVHLATLPASSPDRRAALRVRVARKWPAATGIAGFELESIGEPLPTHQPGAHIDVHLPNGLIRQYSLTNTPGEGARYRLGVKLEPESRGGSQCLHEQVHEGDVLAISEPRNSFPLRRDAVRTVLVAGGIGITPLLAMAQTLHHSGLNCELHYYAQGTQHLAFPETLETLGSILTSHLGLSPEETARSLVEVIGRYESAVHLYLCGPGPMLATARRVAADAGWPDGAVHFEYFANPTDIDDSSSFEISLARSALTLQVGPGQSILEVLRANGVPLPSSCEQGACGTCGVAVLDGEPNHQDVYLNDSERRAGERIMTCVSRAASERLVLDV